MKELALLVQQNVGFLITLVIFVALREMALARYKARLFGWAITYGVLDLLVLLALLLTAGFHL